MLLDDGLFFLMVDMEVFNDENFFFDDKVVK